jgi:AcrR family transcriptional regulator
MRRPAQELGIEAMSLYHHVINKDEVLDGMVDMVFGQIDLPARHRVEDRDASAGQISTSGPDTPSVGDQHHGVMEPAPPGGGATTMRCSDPAAEPAFR